jgi:hypothetical protein
MNIEVRKAKIEDVQVLTLLARTTFIQAFGDAWGENVLPFYLAKTFSIGKIRSSLEKENNVFWLAFADELPVGYAKLKKFSPNKNLVDPKPAQLQKIYVLDDFIGNKIGEKLQNSLFEEVICNKIKTLWLAVWDANDKGIRFYERHGYHKEAKIRFEFMNKGFDFEVMVKTFDV